jgi:hypothetical protein
LQQVTRLTIWYGLKCIFLKLWDEERSTLVGYRSARRLRAAAIPAAAGS